MERLTHIADFGMEDWEETLFLVPSDPTGAYNILDIARHQGEPEFNEILKNISLRLAAIEEILGDEYDLDRLRELAQADREGRCVVLPCKKGDTVWRIVHDATPHITKDRCTNIKVENKEVWVNLIGDRVMGGWNFGKLLFLTREEAEDALRREQE